MAVFRSILADGAGVGKVEPMAMGVWLGCAAFVVMLLNGVLKLTDRLRGGQMGVEGVQGGQAIGVMTRHPCVELPVFEHHVTEVWAVINGLRVSIATIQADVASIKALREANGARLDEMNAEMIAVGKEVSRLAGLIEIHLREHHG